MRLPLQSGEGYWSGVKVFRYDGRSRTGRLICELPYSIDNPSSTTGRIGRSANLKIPLSTLFDSDDVSLSKDFMVVSLPKRISRRTRSRGWKRLALGQSESERSAAGWLIVPPEPQVPLRILIYLRPDKANFMAHLGDSTLWQDMSLVGTHDSCAIYGFLYAQCQQPVTTITQQLMDGVRFLDLRMRVVNGELIMYHGVRNQVAHFTSILTEIHTFLSLHPTETLLVSLKEEVPPIDPLFSELVWSALQPYVDKYWFLSSRLPKLGEVRGRAMIMPRFPITVEEGLWDRGVGLKPDTWPDDLPEGFEVECGEARVRVEDWYGVPSILKIPEKLEAVTRHLEPTLSSSAIPLEPNSEFTTPATSLTISYLSAATIPLAPPQVLAKGIGWPSWGLGVEGLNSKFTRYLLELMLEGKRIRGIVPVDFYRQEGDLGELLVVMNG